MCQPGTLLYTLQVRVGEGVGGGPVGSQQGGVREGLRALVREVRKVYSHRRKQCREIIKNKFPSNYHCLLFINTFRYHLDFTSYSNPELFPYCQGLSIRKDGFRIWQDSVLCKSGFRIRQGFCLRQGFGIRQVSLYVSGFQKSRGSISDRFSVSIRVSVHVCVRVSISVRVFFVKWQLFFLLATL